MSNRSNQNDGSGGHHGGKNLSNQAPPEALDSAQSGPSSKENSPTKSRSKRKRRTNSQKKHKQQQQLQPDQADGQPDQDSTPEHPVEDAKPQEVSAPSISSYTNQQSEEIDNTVATDATCKSEGNNSSIIESKSHSNQLEQKQQEENVTHIEKQKEKELEQMKFQFRQQTEKLLSKLKDRDHQEKKLKQYIETQNAQIKLLSDKLKQQAAKSGDLESQLLQTTKAYNLVEKNLQQEKATCKRLENENVTLKQSITRLKTQLSTNEKSKQANDELMRVVNATLMERETEISILKLRLTRVQAGQTTTLAKTDTEQKRLDPVETFKLAGRSKSEFDRNSYIRSSMIAEAASVSATRIEDNEDRDALVWASVPVELTPSKRPQLLEKTFNAIYGDLQHRSNPSPLTRDRRYKTLPRSMKSPPVPTTLVESDAMQPSSCRVTNLDDSNKSASQFSGNKDSSTEKLTTLPNSFDLVHSDRSKLSSETESNNANIAGRTNNYEIDKTKQRMAKPNEGLTNLAFNDSPYVAPAAIQNLTFDTQPTTSFADNNVADRINTIEGDKSIKESSSSHRDVSITGPESLPMPLTPSKVSGFKKLLSKFRRTELASSKQSMSNVSGNHEQQLEPSPIITPKSSPFKRSKNRSTLVGLPSQMSPRRSQDVNFKTDKPFSDWDTEMLVEWLTTIGLSMYTSQCRKWAKCGAHIMNATPTEVDKGLGITNHLHRKKLRLAISELNGDCDKVTKASAKLDYLWVARWLDDIGLPQYKDTFIEARIDGRVLNYLTVEDLLSMGIKSILHHASIKCGIRVLRSINFDLTLLKRRATEEEIEQINSTRQQLSYQVIGHKTPTNDRHVTKDLDQVELDADLALWTCHRVMEWLRLIDFAEFAPNLRGSGVHGGIIMFEDGFNIDTMCSLLSIPANRTLLRRHLSTFFDGMLGCELVAKKKQAKETATVTKLNPLDEIKSPRKSLWFSRLKSSKVGQDGGGVDDYLCPMYPVIEHHKIQARKVSAAAAAIATPTSPSLRDGHHLAKIPESINV